MINIKPGDECLLQKKVTVIRQARSGLWIIGSKDEQGKYLKGTLSVPGHCLFSAERWEVRLKSD